MRLSTRKAPSLLVRLHSDVGNLPGGVVLKLPQEIALSLILHRAAVPIGDFKVTPDAAITGVTLADNLKAALAA